jgi:thiamine pyrophosphate-dependent acetolactate synthase large subunit-like protein
VPVVGTDNGTPTPSTHSTSQTIPSNGFGKSSRTVAHLLVECLEKEGVRYVFGVPGEEAEDLLFALADSAIRFVPCRHEQGAAFIADVWGRLTGKAGVCLATLGPGATNLLTGVADANLDKAPLVAITAQGGLDRLHHESHQRIDVGFTAMVFNDHDYGLISWKQEMSRGRSIGTRLSNPDIKAFAESFGILAYLPQNPGELREALTESIASRQLRTASRDGALCRRHSRAAKELLGTHHHS